MKQMSRKRWRLLLVADIALFVLVLAGAYRAWTAGEDLGVMGNIQIWLIGICFVFLVVMGIAFFLIQQLADSTTWYEDIIDGIPLAVSVVDNEAKWVLLNRKAEQSYGVDRGKAVGSPSMLKIEKINLDQFDVQFRNGGKPYKLEGNRLFDHKRHPLGYVLTVSDMPDTPRSPVPQTVREKDIDRMYQSMSSITKRFADCTNNLTELTMHHIEIMDRFSASLEHSLHEPATLEQLEREMADCTKAIMDNSGKKIEQITQLQDIAKEVIGISQTIMDTSKAISNTQ